MWFKKSTAVLLDPAAQPSLSQLFFTFLQMGLLGFGGVLPWARRLIVDQHRWLSDREFTGLLSMGQILPGPNICNFSILYGYQVHGIRGALTSLAGLTALPFVLIIAIDHFYELYASNPTVNHALRGMMAVSAGLVLASGLKLGAAQPINKRALWFGGSAFVLIGVLRWPLVPVMAALIVSALAVEWKLAKSSLERT